MSRSVLVTGIGGNVGQGVLRILRALKLELRLVGTNTEPGSAGSHLCDSTYVVPPGFDPTYADRIERICRHEGIELIVPCTDYETVGLRRAEGRLPPIGCSPLAFSEACLDKLATWKLLAVHAIPFARSWLPSEHAAGGPPVVVKPREGRGGRGVVIEPADPRLFDDTHVVQELLRGEEITSAFYVTRERRVHACISLRRFLAGGATVRCETTTDYDSDVWTLVEALNSKLDIAGPCNVQSIVTADRGVVPFEINARVSGTASIRHHFGFRDVQWLVEEQLFGREPAPALLSRGAAVRLLMDVVYPGSSLADIDRGDAPRFLF